MTIHPSRDNQVIDDAALIRLPEVRRITGLGTTTIYQSVARGDFPRQIKIGPKSVAWVKSEVMDWCRRRIAQRNPSLAISSR